MDVDRQAELEKANGLAPRAPAHETRDRLERVRAQLVAAELDGFLVVSTSAINPAPIRYLAGYESMAPDSRTLLLVPVEGPPILLVEHRWQEPAAAAMSWIDDVRAFPRDTPPGDLLAPLDAALADAGSTRIGVLGDGKCDHRAEFADAVPAVEFVDGTPLWRAVVTSLSRYDRSMIERAGTIADRGLAAALSACEPGVPERVVCLKAMDELAALGAEFILSRSVSTRVNIGSFSTGNSNLRPFLFTDAELRPGEMFWIDVIVCYRGYFIDCNRTVSVGEPSAEQRAIYDATRAMYVSMRAAVRGGRSGGELWSIGHDVAERAGYGDAINAAFLGHGTGISLAEPPIIRPGESCAVPPGTYLNLEPGIFVPGVGAACIENTLFVSGTGQMQVNRTGNDLVVV